LRVIKPDPRQISNAGSIGVLKAETFKIQIRVIVTDIGIGKWVWGLDVLMNLRTQKKRSLNPINMPHFQLSICDVIGFEYTSSPSPCMEVF